MIKKILTVVALSVITTAFIYAFGVFVSFEPNIARWPNDGRFMAAFSWVIVHFGIGSAAFGERDR